MLHLHNPNLPSPDSVERKMICFPAKSNQMSEEMPLKTKSKNIKLERDQFKKDSKSSLKAEHLIGVKVDKENISVDKENIMSPRHRPHHLKVKHRSIAEESDFKIKSNNNNNNNNIKLSNQSKEQEMSLKSFLKELMPQKNPALLFNKFIQQVKSGEQEKTFFQYQLSKTKYDINEEYYTLYGEDLQKKMYQDEPDYSDLLKNTRITDGLRAKMLDWMLEIFSKYPEVSSNYTYFKSLSIFHLFIKRCYEASNRILTDSDIHLTGIAAMFLASKYEDESHIQLKDFVNLIGHSSFSLADIKEREWEVYSVLDMNLTFPTSYTFLNFYYYRCFGSENSTVSKNLHDIALYVLKLCNYAYSLVEIRPHTLAIGSIFYAIKLLFNNLSEEDDCCNFQEIEKKMIEKLFFVQEGISINEVKDCIDEIKWLFLNWDSLFPRKMNIQKPEFELRN